MNLSAGRLALLVISLSAGFARSHADDIFVDEFNENSGSLPGGWVRNSGSDNRPETSVIEGTANVSITDFRGGGGGGGAPTMIDSPTFDVFPTGSATTVFSVSISGTSSTGGSSPEAIFTFGGGAYSLRFKLSHVSDLLSIAIVETSGQPVSTEIDGSPLAFPYDGGEVSFTVTFFSNRLRITSTLNSFDTGELLFSEIGVDGFDDITDLGPLARIGLFAETSVADGTATVDYGRVSYVTDATYTPPVTVTPNNSSQKAALAAQIKKLEKQMKAAKRAGNTSKQKKLAGKIKGLKKQLAQL